MSSNIKELLRSNKKEDKRKVVTEVYIAFAIRELRNILKDLDKKELEEIFSLVNDTLVKTIESVSDENTWRDKRETLEYVVSISTLLLRLSEYLEELEEEE